MLHDIVVLFLSTEYVTEYVIRKNIRSINEELVDIYNFVKKSLFEIILKYKVTLYFDSAKFISFFFKMLSCSNKIVSMLFFKKRKES